MGVIYEALGFAMGKFGTALRVAWLPLILLLIVQLVAVRLGFASADTGISTNLRLEPGYTYKFVESLFTNSWPYMALMGVAVILQASYMVPLIRYAGHGIAPHGGMIHLQFGVRHLKYVLATAASFAGVLILMRLAISLGSQWLYGTVVPVLQTQHTVFEEGSLHSVETEQVFGALNQVLFQADQFLFRVGIDMSALQTVLAVPVLIGGLYLMLRLLALPYLAAAREPQDGYTSIGRSFALSSGRNIFPLIGIIVVFVLMHIATLAMFWLGLLSYSIVLSGSEAMIAGFEWLTPNGSPTPLIRGALTIVFGLLLLGASAIIAALNAGLGGALVHRAVRDTPPA